jgi:hypothetical protein
MIDHNFCLAYLFELTLFYVGTNIFVLTKLNEKRVAFQYYNS